MIEQLRLYNFKAFKDTGDIELKPITVLAGPNSSGKSSIFQSLLLLQQTLETETPLDNNLNLDGRFVQAAGLNELAFGRPPLRNSRIGYKFVVRTSVRSSMLDGSLGPDARKGKPRRLPMRSEINFSFRYRTGQTVLDSFDMLCDIPGHPKPLSFSYSSSRKKHPVRMHGVAVRKRYQGRQITGVRGPSFLPQFLTLESDIEEGDERLSYGNLMPLDPMFLTASRNLERGLRQYVKYLGPLREAPRRAYLHSGSPFLEIGKKGEYAAQILWLEKNNEVRYLPSLEEEPVTCSLLDAVNDVFGRLGVGQPIDVTSQKSIMYQLLLGLKGAKEKKQVTIADVGFGVSQLLPIVVMGLRAPEYSHLLFEQPEIHLHPKLQANLADFFLTLASSGKQLLIETHSDHFINRLRRRIAEDPNDELKDKVSILFVHPAQDGLGTTVEPLRVDRYGVIENWPPDFLPESENEAEAIVLAGLEKRQNEVT